MDDHYQDGRIGHRDVAPDAAIEFTVTLDVRQPKATFDFGDFHTFVDLRRLFAGFNHDGVTPKWGEYRFSVRPDRLEVLSAPEGMTQEDWDKVRAGGVGMFFRAVRRELSQAYNLFPRDEEMGALVQAVREVARAAGWDDDGLQIESACGVCKFTDTDASTGDSVVLLDGVRQVGAVRVRAYPGNINQVVIVGYLPHQSLFGDYFNHVLAHRISDELDATTRT